MSRFGRDNSDEEEVAIDISPLIDCIFILLIFFIVTTTFVEEVGFEVDKPQAASASDSDKENVMFSVSVDGHVFYEGKDIGVSGVQPIVRRARDKDPEVPVVVEVAEKAPTGPFVRVIDEARLAGAHNVSVSTKQ